MYKLCEEYRVIFAQACLGQPQMMMVGDVDDMFVPLLDGFLCDPVESSAVIQSLMQQIPNTFCNTKETDTLLLPAVKAGLEALKVSFIIERNHA